MNDHLTAARQKEQVEVIKTLGEAHLAASGPDAAVEGAIGSFELAYRMQTAAPGVLDLAKETAETHRLYGIGEEPTDAFGRQCLLARRMCDAGVRYIQVASGNHWDHHGNIEADLPKSAAKTDKPAAWAHRGPRPPRVARRHAGALGRRIRAYAREPDRPRGTLRISEPNDASGVSRRGCEGDEMFHGYGARQEFRVRDQLHSSFGILVPHSWRAAASPRYFQARQRAGAGAELVGLDAQPLQHAHVQIATAAAGSSGRRPGAGRA